MGKGEQEGREGWGMKTEGRDEDKLFSNVNRGLKYDMIIDRENKMW